MINLDDDSRLELSGITLREEWSKFTPLDSTLSHWDLGRVIQVISPKAAPQPTARPSVSPMAAAAGGAAIGGMIDAMSGDDSPLDGALIGGGLGMLFADDKDTPDPREELGLVFDDGTYLNISINKSEFVRMQTAVAAGRAGRAARAADVSEPGPACREEPLDPETIEAIVDLRLSNVRGDRSMIMIMFGGIIFATFWILASYVQGTTIADSEPFLLYVSYAMAAVTAAGVINALIPRRASSVMKGKDEARAYADATA